MGKVGEALAGRSGLRWCLEPEVKLDREPGEHHEVWRRVGYTREHGLES